MRQLGLHEPALKGAALEGVGSDTVAGPTRAQARVAIKEALERVVMGDDGGAGAALRGIREGEGAIEACLRAA